MRKTSSSSRITWARPSLKALRYVVSRTVTGATCSAAVDIEIEVLHVGHGAGPGELDGVFCVCADLGPRLLDLVLGDKAGPGRGALGALDGVAVLPLLHFLLGPVGLAKTLDALVVVVAIGLGLDQRRA